MPDLGTQNNTVAALTNVAITVAALEKAINRPSHLPGMVVVYGPSGYGKSTAAAYTANHKNAAYIECKSTWTRKATLQAIIRELGIQEPKTIADMTDAICEHLIDSDRPLIIDEMDHLVDKAAVEIIRDIHEGSGAAILLIGEERLPGKLKKWERFHGRILDWVPAQPVDLKDVKELARLYCKKIKIAEDLLIEIHKLARGSVRRICVNLERVQSEAIAQGLDEINLADWGTRQLFTGEAPARRL